MIKKKLIYLMIKGRIIKTKVKLLLNPKYWNYKFNNKKNYFLLNTPNHGNMGDQAIAIAEEKILKDNNISFMEFNHNECVFGKKIINHIIKSKDVILIQGGGYIGDLWMDDQNVFLDIISTYYKNKIVVFPTSIFFENKINIIEFKKSIKKCKDITFFIREKESLERMKSYDLIDFCKYVPDIVTYLQYQSLNLKRENKVVLCLRDDKEKVIDIEEERVIIDYLQQKGYEIRKIDTVISESVNNKTRNKKLNELIENFLTAKFVITDRLHGMLFSTITSTPCISLDNISKKVSATYKWVEYLGYIKNLSMKDIDLYKEIEILLNNEEAVYDNRKLENYYKEIIKVIVE